jgi:hypothetical protein
LDGKPEGKRPHGRLGHRWEDKNKMDFKEVKVGTCRMGASASG